MQDTKNSALEIRNCTMIWGIVSFSLWSYT